jgi:hypothetical protein
MGIRDRSSCPCPHLVFGEEKEMTYKPLEDKAKMDHYQMLLTNMDWTYEFSDDNRAYMIGAKQYTEAVRLGEEIDPAWVVWNEHAPEDEQR